MFNECEAESCFLFYGYTVHGARILVNVCPIVIQRREQHGCGNTAGGSAKYGQVRPCRFPPHLLSCVHQSRRAFSGEYARKRIHNPYLRTLGSCERVRAAGLEPHWNWREPFLPGASPPKYARIAMTLDTVHPAHGAAIVDVERDEAGGSQPIQDLWGAH
jgi:hypothetical protein